VNESVLTMMSSMSGPELDKKCVEKDGKEWTKGHKHIITS